jgi:hypothetical protein
MSFVAGVLTARRRIAMSPTRSAATTIVTTFGAGLACASLAPTAEAAIVDLTPTPQSVPFGGISFVDTVGFAGGTSLVLFQFNDLYGKGLVAGTLFGVGQLNGLRAAPASNTITIGQSFQPYFLLIPTTASGTRTYAFRTASNQLGWFRLNFGGFAGPVTYLAAAYNTTPGESIHSGTTAVPEPTSGALLALTALAAGARGVKRAREKNRS